MPVAEHLLRLDLPVSIDNATQVPCDLKYARLQLFVDDMEIERAEVTAHDIVTLAGSNRVVAGQPLALTLVFDFNSVEFTSANLTLGARDDNGHEVDRALNNIRVELAPELTAP